MLKNLKILREDVAVTQKQLADAVGVSQQSINKYENHNIEPDIDTLIRIADFFNTSIDYLVGFSSIRRKLEEVKPYDLNQEEARLVDQYRYLSKKQKQCINLILESYQ